MQLLHGGASTWQSLLYVIALIEHGHNGILSTLQLVHFNGFAEMPSSAQLVLFIQHPANKLKIQGHINLLCSQLCQYLHPLLGDWKVETSSTLSLQHSNPGESAQESAIASR